MRQRTTIALFFSMLTIAGCQQELADRYLNPDRTGDPTLDKFFTKLLDDNRVRPSYWEISTFVNWHIGVYSQSVGFLNSEVMYQQNGQYVQDRWDDFYRPSANGSGVVAHFREMERLYDAMGTEERKKWEVYMQAARIVYYDHAIEMVDLWGDIPLSEAGLLNKTGEIVYAKFDDAAGIYAEANTALAEAALYFQSAAIPDASRSGFVRQDILLMGDVGRWQRYANTLRLRALMRTSFVNEAAAEASVMEMLTHEGLYPLLSSGTYVAGTSDVLLTPLTSFTGDLHDAFRDWTNFPAPYFLLEQVLKPANDPRIEVLFDKYGAIENNVFRPNTDYNAMPLTLTRVDQQRGLGNYAILDSATFLYNSKLPGVVMTAAEADFLKAEAFERWGGGDAAHSYEQGIKHSIEFYYYLNSLNILTRLPLVHPTTAALETFVHDTPAIHYEGTQTERLAKIWTQKWAHLGWLQAAEAWAEQRRTNYPQLSFFEAPLSGFAQPPTRLTYPAKEKTYNVNYSTVQDDDVRTTRIFWDLN
ncbi:SusD/RagB family nutrient-binding outer membrane lipoprotein [Chryseolinea lacunae]|uniref:SusD/RagB family nutrient-binding outer membrane lipoprotein n=1 Tax=Chryseolinea lacunae TaxID=2801331 RepID=A0ABS1KNT7_9BACT|nr:SusD/RagB family nutrient-binding outer membrane lipoprotein [Chryseolinea lacunae]MBL0741114.1 SusD/RagB family nutrient-binding outer membrane lipoprotein [Chryseolinea lacunae]